MSCAACPDSPENRLSVSQVKDEEELKIMQWLGVKTASEKRGCCLSPKRIDLLTFWFSPKVNLKLLGPLTNRVVVPFAG